MKKPLKETLKKIGGGHLLIENKKISEYSDELGIYIMGLRPKIGNLKFSHERMTGTWAWAGRFIEIYATLGWEGKKEVPIEIGYTEHGGDEGKVVKKLKYNPTFDLKKDAKWYISNMKRYIPGIVKDYE